MNPSHDPPRRRADDGAVVVNWVVKLVIAAAIFGVLVFDAINVLLGHLGGTDDADKAVQAASQTFEVTHNQQTAYSAAVATLNDHESIQTTDFSVDPDGTAHLTLLNTVKTMVLSRTSISKKWTVVSVKDSGKYTGS